MLHTNIESLIASQEPEQQEVTNKITILGVTLQVDYINSINLEADVNLDPPLTMTLDMGENASLSFFLESETQLDRILALIILMREDGEVRVSYVSGFTYERIPCGSGLLTEDDFSDIL